MTVYLCARTKIGEGMAIPEGQESTDFHILMAMSMINKCERENNKECPGDCELKRLLEGDKRCIGR